MISDFNVRLDGDVVQWLRGLYPEDEVHFTEVLLSLEQGSLEFGREIICLQIREHFPGSFHSHKDERI